MCFVVLLVATVLFLPDRYIQRIVTSATEILTDRELRIGSLNIDRSFHPTLNLTDVSFASSKWSNESHLFKVKMLTVSLSLPDLMKGVLRFERVSAKGLQLNLEKNEQGLANWQLSQQSTQLPYLSSVRLGNVVGERIRVNYLDIAKQQQHALVLSDVSLHSNNEQNQQTLSANGKINTLPISVSITLPQESAFYATDKQMGLIPFNLNGTVGNVDLGANGKIDFSSQAMPLVGELRVHLNSLKDVADIINRELPPIGPIDFYANVEADLNHIKNAGIDVPELHLQVQDADLMLDLQGAAAGIPQRNKLDVNLTMHTSDLSWIFDAVGSSKRLNGELTVDAELSGSKNRYDVTVSKAQLDSEQIKARFGGTITDVLNSAIAAIDVDLRAPDMSLITQLSGTKMPPQWGPLAATAVIEGNKDRYSLNQIDAQLTGNSRATATGTINSLIPFDDMHLDVTAMLSTLDEFSTFTPKPLPSIGPVIGNGAVQWQANKFSLIDAYAKYDGPHGVAVARGNIGDLFHFDEARLRVDVDLPDFSALDLFTDFTIPPVDSVVGSANLITVDALDLSARNLKLTVVKDGVSVLAEGAINSIIKGGADLDLSLSSQVDSLRQFNRLVNAELPDVGPIKATARLIGTNQEIELRAIEAIISDPSLTTTFRSNGAYLNRIGTIEIVTEVATPSVQAALRKIGLDSAITKPATLSTRILLNDETINLNNSTLDINGNQLEGNLSFKYFLDRSKKTSIVGDITILRWDLLTLLNQPLKIQKIDNEQTNNSKPDDQRSGKLLSNKLIPFGLIVQDDIDITLQIDHLISALFEVSNATLAVRSTNGRLSVGPFSGRVNEGNAELEFLVDTNTKPPTIELKISLDEIDLSHARIFKGSDGIENVGGAYAALSLVGHGESLAAIMASANGEGGFYIEDLLLTRGVLQFFSSNLLDQLAVALNPFHTKKKSTRFRCAAVAFQLNDGQLKTPFGYAIEADDFSVIGHGKINFNNEFLDLEFSSKPKKRLGFNLNKVASLVKLNGALTAPELSLSQSGLLKFGATVAASIASGGVTLLAEGLFDKRTANSDVCAKALGK